MTAALDISDLKFRYRSGWRRTQGFVVDIPHLELPAGEAMLLTGSSGRGKSTLLHLICGLMDPTEGEIKVNGKVIHAMSGARRDLYRGRHIGVIFQNFNLLQGFSALENVMAALMFSAIPRREHRKRSRALLAQLGIEHPHRDPDRLSIGQQQRVAVARAVACDPQLVLADEPTASLDPENAETAMTLIREICRERGAALLCVSHDPAMPDRFERRETLDDLARTEGQTQRPSTHEEAVA